MAKLSETELRSILAARRADALASVQSSALTNERTKALNYYMGDVSSDMPSVDGKSTAVSSDVADTVEGLMPSLMEIFAGSDDAVRFEPVGPDDIAAADQETAYVNHVFWQKNDGFLVLYSFIKDALLSKLGVAKVFWDKTEREQRETYYDQTPEEFALLAGDQSVDVVAHSERQDDYGQTVHDVTVATKKDYACARVEAVPPEEFGIERQCRKLRDANYCFHEVIRSQADLIAQGYDPSQVSTLTGYSDLRLGTEASARDTVDEGHAASDSDVNRAMKMVRVTEHYVRLDYEGDGKPRLYRVTTGGEDGNILKRDGEFDIVEQDYIPFAAMTPYIMPHRVFGRSVADLVMDIQRIKTALIRAWLDNAYLANNPRIEVPEAAANQETIDDLLVSRPGGIIRTKGVGGLNVLKHPAIGGEVLPMLEYFDATREWRSGVTRQGQGLDANALVNQTATAAMQGLNAAQAKMKLIARVFAETGIRDLFWLLHATIRRNQKQAETVRLTNNWVTIDPRNWKSRDSLTVQVGLGQGGKTERLQQQMLITNMQKDALLNGLTMFVTPANLYNSAKAACRILEEDVELYFTDPGQGQFPPKPNPEMAKLEKQAQIEQIQAQADIATQEKKTQAEMALQQQKFELERELKMLDARLKVQDQEHKHMGEAIKAASTTDETGQPTGNSGALLAALMDQMRKMTGPKRIVRDETGRAVGVEPVHNE